MISPQAIVHEDCFIGRNVRIWQFASILRGSCVGSDSNVGSSAIIDGAIVGRQCSIGAAAQLHPGIALGSGVFIGPGAIFCNDVWPRVEKHGFEAKELFERKKFVTLVESGASVGAGAIILPGTHIGYNCLVAAGAVAHGNIPDNHVLYRDGSITPMPKDGGMSMRMRYVE